MTTLQYRVYLERPAAAVAYRTLELHYYPGRDGRQIIAWMFPEARSSCDRARRHGKDRRRAAARGARRVYRARARAALSRVPACCASKTEGHLLYGGLPRAARRRCRRAWSAARRPGLVDATNGEGIYEAAMSGRFAADASARRAIRRTCGRALRVARRRALRRRLLPPRAADALSRKAAAAVTRCSSPNSRGRPRLAEVLLKEDYERTVSERLYLYVRHCASGFARLACRG